MKAKYVKVLQFLPLMSILIFISNRKSFNLSKGTEYAILIALLVFSIIALLLVWKYKGADNKRSSLWLLGIGLVFALAVFFWYLFK